LIRFFFTELLSSLAGPYSEAFAAQMLRLLNLPQTQNSFNVTHLGADPAVAPRKKFKRNDIDLSSIKEFLSEIAMEDFEDIDELLDTVDAAYNST
jgi:hypothetical protein